MSEPTESPGGTTVQAPNRSPGAPAPDISRQIAALTDAVNQLLAAQRQQQAPSAPTSAAPGAAPDAPLSRERYVREHMSDLPEAYRRQMPDRAADERQLAEAEQEIRRQFRGDLRATLGAGGATGDAPPGASDVGGEIPGGRGPAAAAASLDYARLSPVQQIALGLRDARPVGPGHPEVVHAPAPNQPVRSHEPDTAPAGAD